MAVKNQPTFKFTVSTLEARTTATVGTGREVMLDNTDNNVSAAHTFEGRVTQETGTH